MMFLFFQSSVSLRAVLLRFKRHRSQPRPAYAVAVGIETGSPPTLERKEQCHAPCAQPSTDTKGPLALNAVRCCIAPRRSSNFLSVACGVVLFDDTLLCDHTNGRPVPGASTGRYCTSSLLMVREKFTTFDQVGVITGPATGVKHTSTTCSQDVIPFSVFTNSNSVG